MEMKFFQKKAIQDLERFLTLLGEKQNINKAYEAYWLERNVPVGFGGMAPYKTALPEVPHICFKVPTGGGKTFIACNALKPIFNALPPTKTKAVVWLVPSDSILEQTYKALCDPQHPYRQKINADFSNRVEVYNKQQLLNGQNFNPTSIGEQLSIFVLSYDSFRTANKEGRKAYQQNGNLAQFAKFFGDPELLLADTDETALIQVVRALAPIAIVDESHHATTDLSIEMLKNFNPCFVLDLTATPQQNSNIISFADAVQLKKEFMVKLPVIVYNRTSQTEVFHDAISIRNKLEIQAIKDGEQTGRYIRPIVLFQAQPKGNEDSTTFEKLKRTLLEIGISEEEIAIKTADVNELKNEDLLSEDCSIRYIITVNALKEGWDCPFAYVLATIANRSSSVDVEQILGRVLRLPYTKKNASDILNISYVITSSNDFMNTLDKVVAGLNNAGFSEKDYRAKDNVSTIPPEILQTDIAARQQTEEDFPEIDIASIKDRLIEQAKGEISGVLMDDLLTEANQQAQEYEHAIMQEGTIDAGSMSLEVREKMNVFHMNEAFEKEAMEIRLPQFFIKAPLSLFSNEEWALLSPENLTVGFSLRDKDTNVDFTNLDAEMARIDLDEGSKDAIPKAWKLSGYDSRYFKELFNSKPNEESLKFSKNMIYGQLSKLDTINDRDLRDYISRIVDNLSPEQIADLQQSPYAYISKIKKKINSLLAAHTADTFRLWLDQAKISCKPSYTFKNTVSPTKFIQTIPKSLYAAEEEMNGLELDVVWNLSSLPNIKWWHRNMSRTGFNINGFINAYPDIIAMTTRGHILVIEPKGDFLENSESRQKVELGKAWEHKAGETYRYYMVFKNRDLNIEGAYLFDRFMEIVKEL